MVFGITNYAFADDDITEQSISENTTDLTNSSVSPNAIVTDIHFDGLKRTKEKYLKSVLKQYIGKQIKDIDTHEIETEIQKIGLFDSVVATIQQELSEQAFINISLIEKWAIVPIPLLSYVDEWMGGLILEDTNAFGENDNFSIGAEGSKSRVRVTTSFSTPSVIGKPGLSFSASGAKDKVVLYDMNKNRVLEYQSINYNLDGKLNYKFSLVHSAVFGIGYRFADNQPDDDYVDFKDSRQNMNLRMLSLNGKYNFEISDWNGWFLSKTQITVNGEIALNQGDEVIPSVMLTLRYQHPVIWDRLRFVSHAAGYYSYHSKVPMYKKGRTVGVDFLPNWFVSPIMVAGGAGFEVGVYRFSLATFSIGAQYQVFYGRDWDKHFDFHHGWSCAVHGNLNRVAYPAFSIGLTQDVTNGNLSYALGLGMSL